MINDIFLKLFRRIELLYANSSYERKRQYLLKKGAKIGENTRMNCYVDSFGTEPYLIEVGKDCLFAADIRFITHDGGVKVLNTLKKFNGEKMDIISPIKIEDNVYIGTGAYIMPGVRIGSNSIVGAHSVVTKDIPKNSVAVGIPARVIKGIEEYYNSNKIKNKYYKTANLEFKDKKNYFEKNKLRERYFEEK